MSATNRGSIRVDKDHYPTPIEAVKPLVDRIDFSRVKTFLEPCKGDGRILNLVPEYVNKYWTEIREGKDYFKTNFSAKIDLIITNPPFSLSMEFLKKSMQEAHTVCYLQRLNWLGSNIRKDFWQANPPDKLFALSKRPKFLKELGLGNGTDATEYGWFIWDYRGVVKGDSIEVI